MLRLWQKPTQKLQYAKPYVQRHTAPNAILPAFRLALLTSNLMGSGNTKAKHNGGSANSTNSFACVNDSGITSGNGKHGNSKRSNEKDYKNADYAAYSLSRTVSELHLALRTLMNYQMVNCVSSSVMRMVADVIFEAISGTGWLPAYAGQPVEVRFHVPAQLRERGKARES